MPYSPPTSEQLATLLDPAFLGRTVTAFVQKRHPRGFTKEELFSEAADFILSAYSPSKFDAKKSKKQNTATVALMAHAAVSIYHRLALVCRKYHAVPIPEPLALLPFELASEDRGRRVKAQELAEHRIGLLEAALDLDDHPNAAYLKQALELFRKKPQPKEVAASMNVSRGRIYSLFRWAAKRYKAVLN